MATLSTLMEKLASDCVRIGAYGGATTPKQEPNRSNWLKLQTGKGHRYDKQGWADYIESEYLARGVGPAAIGPSGLAMAATYRNSLPELKLAVKYGQNLEQATATGRAALMRAASRGCLRLVEELVQAGASLEARDKDGRTALWLALAKGKVNCTEFLVFSGADFDAIDAEGRTELQVWWKGSGLASKRSSDDWRLWSLRVLKHYVEAGVNLHLAKKGEGSPFEWMKACLTPEELRTVGIDVKH